jgi:hypothetical protein
MLFSLNTNSQNSCGKCRVLGSLFYFFFAFSSKGNNPVSPTSQANSGRFYPPHNTADSFHNDQNYERTERLHKHRQEHQGYGYIFEQAHLLYYFCKGMSKLNIINEF